MEERIRAALPGCAAETNTEVAVADAWTFGETAFDPELIELVRRATADLGVPCRDMMSQAGHDAYHLARAATTVLLLTPCDEGIRHNQAETHRCEHQLPGRRVLIASVWYR